jgi:hypothetical protein
MQCELEQMRKRIAELMEERDRREAERARRSGLPERDSA